MSDSVGFPDLLHVGAVDGHHPVWPVLERQNGRILLPERLGAFRGKSLMWRHDWATQ